MGAMVSMTSFAQEDVTHYIQNAGFDEDLTWQADGSKKAIIGTQKLSDRSIAAWAEDYTVYATVNPSTPKSRPDGRTLDATNGFKGRIKGWTLETNGDFPGCEWTYFGTLPYALGEQAIPVADDGSTYITVPAKPEDYNTDDNTGFVYMRAGWGGMAIYKQTVHLPCAKYRLEYWSININPNGTNGKNLSKVTCRKDTWPDETGFSATMWTKHEIEFTPTAEFTIELGFESSGGSNSNPFLCVDGIKLYKIDEADRFDIFSSELYELQQEAASEELMPLVLCMDEYMTTMEDLLDKDPEGAVPVIEKRLAEFREAIAEAKSLNSLLKKMDYILQTTENYPGKADFEAAIARISGYVTGQGEEGVDVVAQILGAPAEAKEAMKAYFLSKIDTATPEDPADLTVFVSHPWFINDDAEPMLKEGVWEFPKQYNEETGEDQYTEGSKDSPDLNSEGWYIAGIDGGDQRLNWQRGRSCWNAWNNNFTGAVAVAQDLEGLPNGYYTLSADLITQTSYATDQHVFLKSVTDRKQSAQTLTVEGWDENNWETISMTGEEKVLVVNGKLTIGAEGTGTGSGSAGWFCATNFKLNFVGKASQEEIEAALSGGYNEKMAEAKAYVENMHFKGDKKQLTETIAMCENAMTLEERSNAIETLNKALAEAQTSEAAYYSYFPEDGNISFITDVEYNVTWGYYDAANEIAAYAYNYTINWLNGEEAHYYDFGYIVDQLKDYINVYVPVYRQAADLSWEASEAAMKGLNEVMTAQKALMMSEIQPLYVIETYVSELKTAMFAVNKQTAWDNDKDATDYTAFIQNPNLEAETGWQFDKGNGNTNTTGGQWFDGSGTRYIDSYNSNGLNGYVASQVVTGLPNGTYTVGAYVRTPAEGAYIFADNTFVEIPMSYHWTINEETGEDMLMVASDKWGPLWEEAVEAVNTGYYTEQQEQIYFANNGEGRGWKYMEIANVVVNNHQLIIGAACGSEALGTEKIFAGSWFSVGGWTLTMTSKGDNSGWDGPMSGEVESANELYIAEGLSFSKTKVNTLPISLKNEDQIVGFQFDVVLPDGMTLALNTDNEEDITTTSRTKNHSLSSNILEDGSIRVIGTSLQNKIVSGADGVLVNMGIEIASWLTNGDYPVLLKNVKMTNADKQTLTCNDKIFYVKVGGKMGDVNHDDAIDVTDAVLIIDEILVKHPANFDASLADVNNDGSIDVTDVVMVIDAILGKIQLARGVEATQKDLTAYTAFQMDLTIPAGYVLEGVELTKMAEKSHSLAYNMQADGCCRVVVFSMDNEALPGAWDEVIRLNLRGQGDAMVNVDRAMFVTVGGERHELLLNGTTSIAQLSTLNSQFSIVYDLQGRKVEKSSKGVYVENGRKVVIK